MPLILRTLIKTIFYLYRKLFRLGKKKIKVRFFVKKNIIRMWALMKPVMLVKQKFLILSLEVIAFVLAKAIRWQAILICWFRGYATSTHRYQGSFGSGEVSFREYSVLLDGFSHRKT